MRNLVFYSDQITPANAAIDARLTALLARRGPGRRIGYVASGPEPDRRFFRQRQDYYARQDLDLCLFFEAGTARGADDLAALLRCDAIHLAGGHTAGFLRRLSENDLLAPLRRWAEAGGVLIGTSAGAILMTPTIATDALFSGAAPDAHRDAAALDLVPFEFFPHLDARPSYLDDLIRYSRATPRPILACADGDGVVVTEGVVRCVGAPLWIADGVARPARDFPLRDLSGAPPRRPPGA